MKKWDVIIIGSGISSLTCAALLSKKGKSVCVLEQYNKPGGYLHCFNRFGERFDTGAHYIGAMGKGQPFYTLLNFLKVYEQSHFVPLDPNGFDVLKFPDFQVEFPQGYPQIIERLSELFPNEHLAITTYFSKIQEVAQNFPTYEFSEETDISPIMHLLEKSLASVVEELTTNQKLQAVFYAYCTLHGVEATEVSFAMHAIVTDSLIRGPYGFAKGGDALAKSFVKRIEDQGGNIFFRKKVSQIKTENKLFKSVVTEDGEIFEGTWLISAIHPKATFALVDEQNIFTPAFTQRMKKIKESGGIFGIYAVCETKPHLSPLKNYHYFGSSEPSRMLKYEDKPSKPNAVFLSPANRTGDTTKNAFSMNIHAASPIAWFDPQNALSYGKRSFTYKNTKENFANSIIELLDSFESGFKSSLSQFVTSSPVTNLHFNGSAEGSSYGIYHSSENTGARALGPRTHIANLLLTGQSTLFPGLLGAAISGLRTAGHILGIKPLLKELRESVEHP